MKNEFIYETNTGSIKKGYFNIYQAKNGKIYLQLGDSITPLTNEQLNQLGIDIFDLKDFDLNDYRKGYNLQLTADEKRL
jgi:hypothetical protein